MLRWDLWSIALTDLLALPADRIEKDDAGAGSIDPDLLDGVVKGAEGDSTIKMSNPQRLLRDEFAALGASAPRAATGRLGFARGPAAAEPQPQRQVSLVSFDLGAQEYALPLDRVREIIPLPGAGVGDRALGNGRAGRGDAARPPAAAGLVARAAGIAAPMLVAKSAARSSCCRWATAAVGIVADRTREILRIDPGSDRPGAGAAHARGGRRGDHLDLPPRSAASASSRCCRRTGCSDPTWCAASSRSRASKTMPHRAERKGTHMADEQFIVFRLGDQEYGLPIAAVDEIARAARADHPAAQGACVHRRRDEPARQRRADHGSAAALRAHRRRNRRSARRILVLAVGGARTGFMVDGVSEVMKVPAAAIQPAPELSPEQMRLIGRVANLDAQGRMILLVDPAQLLDRGRGRRAGQVRSIRPRARVEGFVIRLLIADDSALMRKLLEGIFLEEGDFDIRLARNGAEALELVRSFDPQVVTLDVQMPGMDGLTCLSQIMIEAPRPVVMISALTAEGAEATLEAIELGAVDFIAKPGGTISLEIDRLRPILVEKVRVRRAGAHPPDAPAERAHPPSIPRRWRRRARRRASARPVAPARARRSGAGTGPDRNVDRRPGGARYRASAVAGRISLAGDGGPAHAGELHRPLRQAARPAMRAAGGRGGPADAAAGRERSISAAATPILIVAPRPTGMIADVGPGTTRLSLASERGADGDAARSSTMTPTRLIGVLMTGMGRDGADAMTRLRKQGGRTIAEAESTAVVWGMPGELVKNGGAEFGAAGRGDCRDDRRNGGRPCRSIKRGRHRSIDRRTTPGGRAWPRTSRALSSPDAEARWSAARALGRFAEAVPRAGGGAGRRAGAARARSDHDRADAHRRRGERRGAAALPALARMRPCALRPSRRCRRCRKRSRRSWRRCSATATDVRILATELARNMPAADATRLLCGLLEKEQHPNVCAAAVDVLAEVGTREPAGLEGLRRAVRRHAVPAVRHIGRHRADFGDGRLDRMARSQAPELVPSTLRRRTSAGCASFSIAGPECCSPTTSATTSTAVSPSGSRRPDGARSSPISRCCDRMPTTRSSIWSMPSR